MRLLNTRTFEMMDFLGNDIPPYVILSHTWGPADEEVTYHDFVNLATARRKAGFRKIDGCCAQARQDKFEWVWIDSCCIDKSSSAELSEAINSMFQWYRDSHICYAYLSDVVCTAAVVATLQPSGDFFESRWFSRGWTLQELIAPQVVTFYNHRWEFIGTKSSFASIIQRITNIPVNILSGGSLSENSVAEIMSWARVRKTTRVEDMAYSLLGLFNINMPLLYGEGNKAFIRLQEEILKSTGDYSLFAWTDDKPFVENIFASSPSQFRERTGYIGFKKDQSIDFASISPSSIWGSILHLHMQLGSKTEDGYYPAYLNFRRAQSLVCIMIQPNGENEGRTWRRRGSWTFRTIASLSEFKPRQLYFKVDVSATGQSLYECRYTSFIFKKLPPCMRLLKSKHGNSRPIEKFVDGEVVQECVHDTADSNDHTSVQILHYDHWDSAPIEKDYSLGSLPESVLENIRKHIRRDGNTLRSRLEKREDLEIPNLPGVIELTLSTFGLHTRAAWCDLHYLDNEEVVAQSAKSSSQMSDSCISIMVDRSTACGRLLTVAVKPTPDEKFTVEISCCAVNLESDDRELIKQLDFILQRTLLQNIEEIG